MNTLGIKLYFSENDDNGDDDDYCETDKTLNIGNNPEMLLCCQKKRIRCEKLDPSNLN